MPPAAIVDIDGTLVDSNYQHALAWYRALRDHGVVLPVWRIHRHVGMGGDQIVSALAGDDVEARLGDDIRARHDGIFEQVIEEVAPLPGARELLVALGEGDRPVVLASSAKPEEVDRYLDLLEARQLVTAWTTAADVAQTKPEPDLVLTAMRQAPGEVAAMIGDSSWDCEAAKRAGLPVVGVLTGGFGADELHAAGAVAVFTTLDDLREGLADTPLRP